MIYFSKPSITNKEIENVNKVLKKGILTDGYFQKKTELLIKKKIKSKFIALTQSCTDALELASSLIKLKPNDEVIMPSYTFTSTANAVIFKGAKPVFADINSDDFNINQQQIEKLITKKTKAIFVVHYGGNCINLEKILKIKKKYKLFLIEDCAHAFLSSYNGKFAGTFGDIGVFSFHETKNVVGGQGGAISINNEKLLNRVNFLLDKGTNRQKFLSDYRKQFISEKKTKLKRNYYTWVDFGSEYRATELSSSLIYSQLIRFNELTKKRKKIWFKYYDFLKKIKNKNIELFKLDKNSKNVFHLFAFKIKTEYLAKKLRYFLQKKNIPATFHYVPLHSSPFGKKFKKSKNMDVTNKEWKKLIRLPIYPDLKDNDIQKILNSLSLFFKQKI